MKRANALDLVNTVDSRHQAIQPVLRKFVNGKGNTVTNAELDALPSPFAPAVEILKDVRDGKVDEDTILLRDELDTFSEPLKPVLSALIEGLED